MMHPEDLLKNVNKALAELPADYEAQRKLVDAIDSYEALGRLNGEKEIAEIADKLGLDPANNPLFKERLIGKENNLMSVSFLNQGIAMARTVCRVIVVRGEERIAIGTGFMVSPNLMMTNEHVIGNMGQARQYCAEFEYDAQDGHDTKVFDFDPDTFFLAHALLDFCVVAVKPTARNRPEIQLSEFGWNPLKPVRDLLYQGKPLSIIQHPEGLPKMIAFRNSKVVNITPLFVHYTTDTQRGSSGSPVTNDNWNIIALHRSGIPERDENNNILLSKGGIYTKSEDESFIIWKANEGVVIDAILAQIAKSKMPDHQQPLQAELLKYYLPPEQDNGYQMPTSR